MDGILVDYTGQNVPFASAGVPPAAFLLSSIEKGGEVLRPAINPDDAASIAIRNPRGIFVEAKPILLRAWVTSVIDLMMLDALHDKPEGSVAKRSDYLGGTLIWLAYTYGKIKGELPEEVRQAYETGLKKLADRLLEWGPGGMQTDMALFAPVGLAYCAKVLDDNGMAAKARAFSEPLYTSPQFFNAAGFFPDEGCFDASYNGISLFFATWTGLITEWEFVRSALAQSLKLRSYLMFPEPPQSKNILNRPLFFGPSHFSSRTSADSAADQWGYLDRAMSTSTLTDYALPTVRLPEGTDLKTMEGKLQSKLKATQDLIPQKASQPWKESHWVLFSLSNLLDRPKVYGWLSRLKEEGSPMMELPFQRAGNFVEKFGDVLVVAKFEKFGVVIFTGDVGTEYQGLPRGFGGGNVSAFWTPATGAAILGRRRGVQGNAPDSPEEWLTRPVNALSGKTANGKLFSSARCSRPKREIQTSSAGFEVAVSGSTGSFPARQKLRGTIDYKRIFKADSTGLAVDSRVTSATKDVVEELYEIIPFFQRDDNMQRADHDMVPPFRIEFQVDGRWADAGIEPREKVTAIRCTRHDGAVEVALDQPGIVRLSPTDWQDGYQSKAICRNVLISYPLPNGGAEGFQSSIRYRIVPSPEAR